MSLWKKITRILRKLAGKDLPKSVTKEPEPIEYVSLKQAPLREPLKPRKQLLREKRLPEPTKTLDQKIRERWLPQPTTKRKTRDKTHRPPAAQHNISRLMKSKGGRHSKYYHQTIKKSPHLKIEEEQN